MRTLAISVMTVALAVGACSAPGNSQAPTAPPATPRLVELPVSVFAQNPNAICGGVQLAGPIYLAAEADVVYGQSPGGTRISITWPKGFRAVFDPGFTEVLTDSGTVFARAGDDINTTANTFHGQNICEGIGIAFW